jgi:hypothetical protein
MAMSTLPFFECCIHCLPSCRGRHVKPCLKRGCGGAQRKGAPGGI